MIEMPYKNPEDAKAYNKKYDSLAQNKEKRVELIESPAVSVIRTENDRQVIDMDIEKLQSGKVYRVDYQGETYAVERKADGKLVFYEVLD